MEKQMNITKDTSPDAIERDIAQTREELSRTVSEIEERFSSEHFKARVQEMISEKKEQAAARGRELAGRAKDTAQRMSAIARDNAVKGKNRMMRLMQDNPAAVLILSFELGAWIVIGLKSLMPATGEEIRVERQPGIVVPMPERSRIPEEQIRKAA